jgi:hypothetical protein
MHPGATCGRRRTTRYFSFASGFTTSRAHSMNSFTSGLRVRFFKVMIPTGQGGMGSVTGKTLSGGRFEPNRKTVSETIARYGPFASSAFSK